MRSFGSLSMKVLMSVEERFSAGGGCFCTCICTWATAVLDDNATSATAIGAKWISDRGMGMLLPRQARSSIVAGWGVIFTHVDEESSPLISGVASAAVYFFALSVLYTAST